MLADLPAGSSPTPLEDDSGDSTSESCLDEAFATNGLDEADATSASSSSSQSEFGPFLTVGASVDVDQASKFFEALPEGFAARDDDGTTTRVRPVPFGKYGDDTFAVRLDLASYFFPASALLAFAREDDAVLYAIYVVIGGGVDAELVGDVFEIMLSSLLANRQCGRREPSGAPGVAAKR